jgi:ADP-ribose pyrophosphatase
MALRTVFTGRVFRVETGEVHEPGGVTGTRDVVRHQGSSAVLPVQRDGTLILIRQYRTPFRRNLLELPAGRIDFGETALQAARRELREELGLRARRFERLMRILPTPGFCDETVTIFRATGLIPGVARPESDERIEPVFLTLGEAIRAIDTGRIEDAKTICAVLLIGLRSPVPSR